MNLKTFDGDVSEKALTSFHVTNLSETINYDVTEAAVGQIHFTSVEVPPHPDHITQLPHLSDLKFPLLPDPTVHLQYDPGRL